MRRSRGERSTESESFSACIAIRPYNLHYLVAFLQRFRGKFCTWTFSHCEKQSSRHVMIHDLRNKGSIWLYMAQFGRQAEAALNKRRCGHPYEAAAASRKRQGNDSAVVLLSPMRSRLNETIEYCLVCLINYNSGFLFAPSTYFRPRLKRCKSSIAAASKVQSG